MRSSTRTRERELNRSPLSGVVAGGSARRDRSCYLNPINALVLCMTVEPFISDTKSRADEDESVVTLLLARLKM